MLGADSARRMKSPSAPPGKSAASAFEIRFWVDIIPPCPCRLNRRSKPLEAYHPCGVRLLDLRFIVNLSGELRPLIEGHTIIVFPCTGDLMDPTDPTRPIPGGIVVILYRHLLLMGDIELLIGHVLVKCLL
jgi:hypothetical protein